MKKKKIILGILIVLWLCLIWGHSMQPANVSAGESGRILAFLRSIFPTLLGGENGEFIIRKAAHFTEFFILGILLCMEFGMELYGALNRFVVPSLVGLLVAFIDETIQLFVVGRSGEVRDMWIDFAGVAVGVIITMAFTGNKGGQRYRR